MRKYSKVIYVIFTTIYIFIVININNIYVNKNAVEFIPVGNISSSYENKVSHEISFKNKKDANSSDIMVYPGGKPLGIKINTRGALVIAMSDIEINGEKVTSPAALAGINIGDSIISINGNDIKKAEDIATYVGRSKDANIEVEVDRKGQKLKFTVHPILSRSDDHYKLGLWVRDSVAGVGTLTFYDKESGKFGALGHPITDTDTCTIMSVAKGEIVDSNIVSVRKGARGNPGELRGIFTDGNPVIGNIETNCRAGVFGLGTDNLISKNYSQPMRVGFKNEVKEGKAQILTTIDGGEPQLFDIVIEKLLNQTQPDGKSMIIKVTDEECLEKTGGIIQGMSGSPIIQNGKIVGAVTHVLVNKPDTGYGIYMDWMMQEAGLLDNNKK